MTIIDKRVIDQYRPKVPIYEPHSGMCVNMPMSLQGGWLWWQQDPETVERIMQIRERLGIEVDDFPIKNIEPYPEPMTVPFHEQQRKPFVPHQKGRRGAPKDRARQVKDEG